MGILAAPLPGKVTHSVAAILGGRLTKVPPVPMGRVQLVCWVQQAAFAGLRGPYDAPGSRIGRIDSDLAFRDRAVERHRDALGVPVVPRLKRLGLFECEVQLRVAVDDAHLAEDELPEQVRCGRAEDVEVRGSEGDGCRVLAGCECHGGEQV
ncbi:hypothetical protein [Kitasatospora purpeofusca]|uniref:hypothetical protein n=1 Tax=Kitasatospora purpeofusca TaxID=67352 RepID=UPI00364D5F31